MSSVYVRDQIKNFITAQLPSEVMVDLTAEFDELEDLLTEAGIADDAPWLGIQFLAFDEVPIDILSTNDTGKYRETGSVLIHVVDIAKKGGHNDILIRAEAIRNKIRGRRIGSIIIESVSPANFGVGVTLSFEGGYTSATINVQYQYDVLL